TKVDDIVAADAESRRRRRAHESGVVPSQLGDRLGKFLQPAVVGETPVVDAGVGEKRELDRGAALALFCQASDGAKSAAGIRLEIEQRRFTVRQKPPRQGLFPESVDVF